MSDFNNRPKIEVLPAADGARRLHLLWLGPDREDGRRHDQDTGGAPPVLASNHSPDSSPLYAVQRKLPRQGEVIRKRPV